MNAHTRIEGEPIDPELLARAEALGMDVTGMTEGQVYMAVRRKPDPRSPEEKRAADQKWAEENRATMEAWNDWADRNGLPFAEYRQV